MPIWEKLKKKRDGNFWSKAELQYLSGCYVSFTLCSLFYSKGIPFWGQPFIFALWCCDVVLLLTCQDPLTSSPPTQSRVRSTHTLKNTWPGGANRRGQLASDMHVGQTEASMSLYIPSCSMLVIVPVGAFNTP